MYTGLLLEPSVRFLTTASHVSAVKTDKINLCLWYTTRIAFSSFCYVGLNVAGMKSFMLPFQCLDSNDTVLRKYQPGLQISLGWRRSVCYLRMESHSIPINLVSGSGNMCHFHSTTSKSE
jgi:hypothetical protein